MSLYHSQNQKEIKLLPSERKKHGLGTTKILKILTQKNESECITPEVQFFIDLETISGKLKAC